MDARFVDTLRRDKYPDEVRVQAELEAAAQEWASQFNANALVTLMKAAVRFDVADRYPDIRAQVLYVISTTDPLFPPEASNLARLDRLPRGRNQYHYLEIDSRYGHLASGVDHAKWSGALADLIWGRRGPA